MNLSRKYPKEIKRTLRALAPYESDIRAEVINAGYTPERYFDELVFQANYIFNGEDIPSDTFFNKVWKGIKKGAKEIGNFVWSTASKPAELIGDIGKGLFQGIQGPKLPPPPPASVGIGGKSILGDNTLLIAGIGILVLIVAIKK